MNELTAAKSTNALLADGAVSRNGKLSPHQRWCSFAEFLLAAVIVIGHNVFHKLPNEVPILFLLALLSFRLRDGNWRAMGLRRPDSWKRTVLLALAVAALRIVLGTFVIDPIAAHFWPPAMAPRGLNEIAGHLTATLKWLLFIWTFAAFGEEIGYRGYLLNRASEAGGKSKLSDWLAVLLVAVLFGYGHFYKGPAGILDSGMAGLILGAAYLLSRRNLWVCVLAHGFIDTVAVLAEFLGWAT